MSLTHKADKVLLAIDFRKYIRAKLTATEDDSTRQLVLAAFRMVHHLPDNSNMLKVLFSDQMTDDLLSDIKNIVRYPHFCTYKNPMSAVVVFRLIMWSAISATMSGMLKSDIDALKILYPKYMNMSNAYEPNTWNDHISANIMKQLGLIKHAESVIGIDSRTSAGNNLRFCTFVPREDRRMLEVLDSHYIELANKHLPAMLVGDTLPVIGGIPNLCMPDVPLSKIQAAWLIKFVTVFDKKAAQFIANQARKGFAEVFGCGGNINLPDISRKYTAIALGSHLDYWVGIYTQLCRLVSDFDSRFDDKIDGVSRRNKHHAHSPITSRTTISPPQTRGLDLLGVDDDYGYGVNRRYHDGYWSGSRWIPFDEPRVDIPEKDRKKLMSVSEEDSKIKVVRTKQEEAFNWLHGVLEEKGWTWTNA